MMLTASTLEEMRSEISIPELPQTFQDAIAITRSLHVRYLWIDSLCTMQDSQSDWTIEASMMKNVYANPTCTIAATWGSKLPQWLFVERDPNLIMPCKIVPRWTEIGAKDNSPRLLTPLTLWQLSIDDGILNKRGCVFQGRLLSPRVIHFTRDQIFWVCQKVANETFPALHAQDLRLGERPVFFKDNLLGAASLSSSDREKHFLGARLHWHLGIVAPYLKCVLTKPEDKLIAISGIAKLFQDIFQDDYLAGLWRKGLPQQLLWRASGNKQANGLPSAKPPHYRAPSWTWASVDADISPGPLHTDGIVMISVQDANVQPLTDDPTGQVCGGHIQLRGMIAKAEFWAEHRRGPYVIRYKIGAEVVPDPRTRIGTDVYFLLVTQGPDSTSSNPQTIKSFQGLLLHPVDETETKFERCGYFEITTIARTRDVWPQESQTSSICFRTSSISFVRGSERSQGHYNHINRRASSFTCLKSHIY